MNPEPARNIAQELRDLLHELVRQGAAAAEADVEGEVWFVLEKQGVPQSVGGPYGQTKPEPTPEPGPEVKSDPEPEPEAEI